MNIRLLAIDIDGTLMPSSAPHISPRNCAALLAAQAAGVEVVIATGRRHAYAMPLIAPMGLKEDSVMISSNGAVVRRFDGELWAQQFLPVNTAIRLCRELRGYGTLVFTFDREGAGALVVENLQPLHARIERWVEANRLYLKEIDPIEGAFTGNELAIQGMVCGGVEEMKRAEKALQVRGFQEEVSMHRTEYPARDLSMLDLLPLGCSKGSALHRLAQLQGLGREEIMAIGDNLNDVEMLEYAGRAVVMGNASQEMLAVASARGWERTLSNDEDGVALTIEAMLSETRHLSADGQAALPQTSMQLCERHNGNPGDTVSEDTMAEWAR